MTGHEDNTKAMQTLSAVEQVVVPVLRAHGASLFDVSFRREHSGWVLRVMIEVDSTQATGGVSVDLCADVSRDISAALDVADTIKQAYSLEVSSPGVERPLRHAADYERFTGRTAKIFLNEPIEKGQRMVRGVLAGVQDERVRITRAEDQELQVPLTNIKRAHLAFEMPTHPKKSTTKQKKRPVRGQ